MRGRGGGDEGEQEGVSLLVLELRLVMSRGKEDERRGGEKKDAGGIKSKKWEDGERGRGRERV